MNYTVSYSTILYLSRGSNRTRIIENEEKLLTKLRLLSQKNNYNLVFMAHPTDWSTSKQRVTFYNASVILGLHGGAFSNIAFCNSNATVIEINYGGRGRRDCFFTMALALQLNYIRFPIPQNIFRGGQSIVYLNDTQIEKLVGLVESNMPRVH